MQYHDPSRQAVVACLILIILSWGTNYPLMKVALQDIPPLAFAAVRIMGGALFLGILIYFTRPSALLPPPGERCILGLVGVLQYAAVLGPAGMALYWVPPGRTVAIVYTMPIWAALFDCLLMRKRLCALQWTGILISVVGILLFMDPGVLDWNHGGTRVGLGLAVMAAASWGLGAVLYGSRKWQSSLMCQAFWQLCVAGAALGVSAALIEFPMQIRYSRSLVLIMLWNWLVPVSLSVWAWGRVLEHIPASLASQALLCTPFVGIALSAVIFRESLPPVFAASALIIMMGASLALLRPSLRP